MRPGETVGEARERFERTWRAARREVLVSLGKAFVLALLLGGGLTYAVVRIIRAAWGAS